MICYLFEAPTYLFFAPDLPELLYYSHIPTSIVALLVGLFVYLNGRDRLLNKLLLLISVLFSLWTLASLIAWTNVNGDFIAFIWPFFGLITALISVFSVYFIYVFLTGEDVSLRIKAVFLSLLAPVILLAHTDLSFTGFNLVDCDAFMFEGLMYKKYYTAVAFLSMVWILVLLIKEYKKADAERRKQILLMGIGLESFLLIFNTLTFIVTYLTILGIFNDSQHEMYGLFGMLVFMVLVGVLIVRYKTFHVGMVAAQALVIALVVLVGSQFTYATEQMSIILTCITLVVTGLVGIVLIRNVRLEVEQRREIEALVVRLDKANSKLKALDKLKSEFVSIASHQLRSPLTAIRGYSSMLLEGSFGKFPDKAREALERIDETSRHMASSIEDYLNVSRIESGNMKFVNTDVNLKELTERIVDGLRKMATQNGLVLSVKSDLSSKAIAKVDQNKTEQVIHNLVNNAIKYTEKGSITVFLHDDVKKKKIFIEIIDTGIGMSEETMASLFGKFERAKTATVSSIKGTGLGLFVAKQMAKGMGGDVTAHSEGEGKGSHFIFELPLSL